MNTPEDLTGLGKLVEDDRVLLYNGTVELIFDRKHHEYYVVENGEKLLVPGVTSAVGKIDKSGPLTQWAANMTVAHIRQNVFKLAIKTGLQVEEYVKYADLNTLMEKSRFSFRDISDEAMDVGKIAHDWLQRYMLAAIDGDVLNMPIPEDESAANCVKAALSWIGKHNLVPLRAEHKVYSRQHHYSGMFDLKARITGCGDPKCCGFTGTVLAIIDWKSSKRLYAEYKIQTAAYLKAEMEEHPEYDISVRILLRLGKTDGEFETMTCLNDTLEDDFDAFLACLILLNHETRQQVDRAYDKAVAKAEDDFAKAEDKAAAKLLKEEAKAEAKRIKEEAKAAEKLAKAEERAAAKAAKPPKVKPVVLREVKKAA